MQEGLSLDVDFKGVMDGIKRLSRVKDVEIKEVFVDQMARCAEGLIRLFPPKNYAQGRRRIMGELKYIFVQMGPKHLDAVRDWEAIGESGPERRFETKRGAVFGVEKTLYNSAGNLERMYRHHQRYRKPNGRTTAAGTMTRDVGRWKFVNRMAVPEKAFERYLKQYPFKRVGMLKAGWVPRQSRVRNRMKKVAKWIERAGKSNGVSGEYSDRMTSLGGGYLKLSNPVRYARWHGGLVRIVLRFWEKRLREAVKLSSDKLVERKN